MKRYILGNSKTCRRCFTVLASSFEDDFEIVRPLADDPEIRQLSDGSTLCKSADAAIRYIHALYESFQEGGENA